MHCQSRRRVEVDPHHAKHAKRVHRDGFPIASSEYMLPAASAPMAVHRVPEGPLLYREGLAVLSPPYSYPIRRRVCIAGATVLYGAARH